MRLDGLVSTIIPVHNRPRLLGEAVQSVLAQTYRPIEIVIVDDGSTDKTPAVASQLAQENPAIVRVVGIENGGTRRGARSRPSDRPRRIPPIFGQRRPARSYQIQDSSCRAGRVSGMWSGLRTHARLFDWGDAVRKTLETHG
jgi:cellulose synthase/poly-beta-1,6-N-acetylglucosamine synthase-like glycosyltransferase